MSVPVSDFIVESSEVFVLSVDEVDEVELSVVPVESPSNSVTPDDSVSPG